MNPHVVVVGGGITGLAAAESLSRAVPPVDVTLIEARTRLGGHIRSEREQGFVLEAGPDVILAAKPAGIELARRVGLGARLQPTNATGSYVFAREGLVRVPDGISGLVPSRFAPFATTPLLSLPAKLRVAAECVIPPRRGDDDESIESFVVRRFGRAMYEQFAEPLLSGISAGDGSRLSMAAMFPQLRAMEREHGSLIRGMVAKRTRGGRRAAGNGGAFVTFPGGLGELVDGVTRTLVERSGDQRTIAIRDGSPVERIERPLGDAFRVWLQDGAAIECDAVIVATPAHAAASMLGDLDPELASALRRIEYASTVTVSVAYPADAVPRALDATGYVVPGARDRPVRACTWVSSKFNGRAPDGCVSLRLFLGGARREGDVSLADDRILDLVREELRDVMGIGAEPLFARINRFERAMPQYVVRHQDTVRAIAIAAQRTPSLRLAGAAYGGVGIPDCIRSGVAAGEAAIADLRSQDPHIVFN